MGDNIVAANPGKEMLRLCSHRCPHMHEITLEQTRDSLKYMRWEVRRSRGDPGPGTAVRGADAGHRPEDRLKPPIHTDVLILGCGIAGGTGRARACRCRGSAS